MSGIFDQIINYSPPLIVSGTVNYDGTWDASTNTPTLNNPPAGSTKGDYYVVSVAGTQFSLSFAVGDWIISNGTAWEKVDLTDAVSSVFGRTGAVVGVSTDYSAVGLTNTAIGASSPSTGAFTTVTASSTIAATGAVTGSNLSGTNTGDQTITLTGGVTGSGTGSFAATVVTNANLTGAITSTGNATSLGSFSSANLASALTDETGSGAAVFATSPTLVTPILGTPTSGTVTNLTGTASININGTVGATTPSTVAATTITATGAVTFDGVSFADGTAANTLVTTSGGNVGIGTSSPQALFTISSGSGTKAVWETQRNFTTNRNYQIAVDEYTEGGFTITPSTTLGGSTYTTPLLTLSSTGLAVTGALGATGNVYSGNNGFSIASGTTDGFYVTPLGTMLQSFDASVADGQYVRRRGSNGVITSYYRDTTNVGTISVTTTATAYNTSSDYRLKTISGPLIASGAFIDALKPKVGTWKSNGSKFVGFLADEFAEVSPSSVVGEKDAVDAEGNPKYQSMQASSSEVIANLVAELQSVRQRLAALESK